MTNDALMEQIIWVCPHTGADQIDQMYSDCCLLSHQLWNSMAIFAYSVKKWRLAVVQLDRESNALVWSFLTVATAIYISNEEVHYFTLELLPYLVDWYFWDKKPAIYIYTYSRLDYGHRRLQRKHIVANELWSEFPDFLASQREERRWFVDLLVGDRSLSYLFLCLRENRRHHTSGEEMWRLDQQMSHGSRNLIVVGYQSGESIHVWEQGSFNLFFWGDSLTSEH